MPTLNTMLSNLKGPEDNAEKTEQLVKEEENQRRKTSEYALFCF